MGDRYLNIGERGNFVIQEYSTFSFCADYKKQGYCIWNKDSRGYYKENGQISVYPTQEEAFSIAESLEAQELELENESHTIHESLDSWDERL